MGDFSFTPELRAVLSGRLASFERRRLPLEERKRAVVTLTLVPDDDHQASIVLTRRARGLRRHSGQFALPGGRVDEGETEVEAGLRELEEEVGLRLSPDRILGWLDDFATHSGFLIAPVVVWAQGGNSSPIRGRWRPSTAWRWPIAVAPEPWSRRPSPADIGRRRYR